MIPASIRNMNPGAMYPGPSAKTFGATGHETLRSKDGTHKIATFPTHVHGGAALFHLLHARYTGMTIKAAISRWCGGYYASTYLSVLESRAGVNPDDILTREMVRNPTIAVPIARAMAWQEAGRDYPLDGNGWSEAHAMAFGGERAPAFAPHNDVPSPKPETRMIEGLKTAAQIAAPVAAGTGATVYGTQAPVPPPPAAVTDSISNAEGWQATINQVVAILSWIASSRLVMATVVVASLGMLAYRFWGRRA